MWQTSPKELSSKIFSRRAFIVLVGKVLVLSVILIRLLILQIFKTKEYKTLSDNNRIKFILIYPRRGTIRDINGKPLAYNKKTYKVYFYRQKGESYEAILSPVFNILGHSKKSKSSLLKLVSKTSYLRPVVIKDDVTWQDVARIESEIHRLPGVFIEKSFKRYYSLREKLAHIIGYIGLPSQNEINSYKLQYARDIKIGKAGIEGYLNHSLIGKFGAKRVEVNASRVVVRDLSVKPSSSGTDTTLTIDADCQNFLYSLLPKSSTAAAAVIEVNTGNILSMCSSPSFDPNLFSTEFDQVKWQRLLRDQNSPFVNKVIGKAYPPGSTWKIVTALAILEAGIDPNEKVLCNGSIRVGNRLFKCWRRSGHGYVDLYKAIPYSCNCYFYKKGIEVGINNIYKIAEILGFGNKIDIELLGELKGINPNKKWKENLRSESWTHGDTANASIGQGFVLATPLQLLMMISRVASGKMIFPSLLKDHGKNFSTIDLPFKKSNLAILRKGLIDAINHPRGTSFRNRIRNKQFLMAGKTGTAQVISQDTSAGGKKFSKRLRSHSIFVGYAPIDVPKYASVVIVDNAGWGSLAAAPISRDVLHFVQKSLYTNRT
ncbi:MAG: penicillin-binding protein 2 [Rickettsiales bacterium]|nr:penicillin-binding protein 2 [Rickettsiales bacterium]